MKPVLDHNHQDYRTPSGLGSLRDAQRFARQLITRPIASAAELDDFIMNWSRLQKSIYTKMIGLYCDAFSSGSLLARIRLGMAFLLVRRRLLALKAEVDGKVLDSSYGTDLLRDKFGWYLSLIGNGRKFIRKDLVVAESKDEKIQRKSLSFEWDIHQL
jgi:hypothetical protein